MRTGRNNAFNHLLLHTDIWVSVNGGKGRGHLLSGNTVRTRGSASSSGVIFLSRKSTGLPSSPARFGFLLVNLLSPSWLFSMDCLNVTIESVHSYIFLHSDKIMMLGSKGLLPPLIPDCFALRASTILKTFIIRSFFYEKWLLIIHVLGGSQGQKSSCKQACIRFPTFWPWYQNNYSNKVFKSQGNPSGVAKSFHIDAVFLLSFLTF